MLNLKKKIPDTKHPGNLGHYEKTKPIIIIIEEGEETKLKGPENKIMVEKFPNLRKDIPINGT